MEYRGQIAIAELHDTVPDSYYKLMAKILTGHEAGKECYVAHRGNSNSLSGNVVVRLELPFEETSGLDLDGTLTANFITSTIPEGFEFTSSDKVILCGLWEKRMKNGFDVPIIGKIKNYYDIGKTQSILHYAYKDGKVISYRLYGNGAEVLQYGSKGETLRIRNALDKYLRRLDKRKDKDTLPRLVTIDEEINLEARILNVLAETGLTLIELESQQ